MEAEAAKLTKTKEMVLTGLYENNTADTRRNLWKDYTSESGAIFSYLFTKYTQERLVVFTSYENFGDVSGGCRGSSDFRRVCISYFKRIQKLQRDLQTLDVFNEDTITV